MRVQELSDLSVWYGGKFSSYRNGYFIGFGSEMNTMNKLLKNEKKVATAAGPLIKRGKQHHVVVQKDGGRISLVVDGKESFSYLDSEPLNEGRIGFYLWAMVGSFDNIKIYTRSAQ